MNTQNTNQNTQNTIKIITNNKPRQTIYGYQLTEKQKADFDYIDDIDSHDFVIYKGNVIDISEFMRIDSNSEHFKDWDGYSSDSFFSGTLIKHCDDTDYVIIGWFYQ